MRTVKKTVRQKPTMAEASPMVWAFVRSGVMKFPAVACSGEKGRKAFS